MILPMGKIPGHSGTEFKHRKVFSNKSEKRNSSVDIVLERRETSKPYRWFFFFKIITTLSFICISLILLFSLAYRIESIELYVDTDPNKNVNLLIHPDEEGNQYLLDESFRLYEEGNLTRAHEKLYALLIVDVDNKEAEYLLLKVLESKCAIHQVRCKDFKYYTEMLNYKYNAFQN